MRQDMFALQDSSLKNFPTIWCRQSCKPTMLFYAFRFIGMRKVISHSISDEC